MSDSNTDSTTETKQEEQIWQGNFFALVLHPKQEKLLLRDGTPPSLPEHELHDDWMWSGQAARLSAKDFGLVEAGAESGDDPLPFALGYRRWCVNERDKEARTLKVAAVYDAEIDIEGTDEDEVDVGGGVGPQLDDVADRVDVEVATPDGWRWAGADDAAWTALPEFEAGAARAFLAERADGILVPHRQPWAIERGRWLREAVGWIDAELAERGRRRTGPIEIVKSWSISFVLSALTEEGKVYFKASGEQPLFVNEAAFARAFAQHFADLSPEIVALDETRGWLLLEDFGTPVGHREGVDEEEKRRTRIDIVRLQARVQKRAAELGSDALLAAGCLDRRLPVVLEQIEPLLDDPLMTEALEEEELERLRALAPKIATALAACVDLGLPDTLVHGDLHLGNVAQREGSEGWVIFDWTDACLAHPFTDLIGIRTERDEEMQGALREAYFEEWADVLPADAVEHAWALGGVAFHLHHAITYQHIVNHVEQNLHGEHLSMVPFHLRKLIEVVDGLESGATIGRRGS